MCFSGDGVRQDWETTQGLGCLPFKVEVGALQEPLALGRGQLSGTQQSISCLWEGEYPWNICLSPNSPGLTELMCIPLIPPGLIPQGDISVA